MPTEDDFAPSHPLPLFLTERAHEPERQDRAVISSRFLITSILVIAATAIGIGLLSVGNPATLFAEVTASLFDNSALQPRTDPSTPAIQSAADTQALPPTAKDAPTRDEMAAAVAPADQSQTEIRQPSNEELFKQFQAWAAEQDARAEAQPVQPARDAPAQVQPVQPAQDAPAQVAEDDRTPVRPMHRHRRRSVQNARAEVRPVHNPRARVRREQDARVQARPVQDPRAQVQPAQQEGQTPSFLQSLGLRQ